MTGFAALCAAIRRGGSASPDPTGIYFSQKK